MGETFYQVKLKNLPNSKGTIIRQDSEGKLEVFAGTRSLSDLECRIEGSNLLIVNSENFAVIISEKEAMDLKSDYVNWQLAKGYVAHDTSVNSILSNTPGTPNYSRRNI